ncbi:MAG TPA: hypothetical protein EYN71_06050 [Flavobacteriales bacterium]|nr:hypothetical protein [Flavobacteriales bacterium]HIO67993.1 hypothetical protein [Flavobacteriales bacterium]
MKKIAFLLMLPLTLIFTRCDTGGREDGEENGTEETVDLGRVEELDLNEYGYPLVISVPQAGDIDSSYTIEELDWGALEIRVGLNFAVQISGGDGDMGMAKEDIAMDDVYEATYVVDEPDAILYAWALKGMDMEPEYRFFVIKMDDANAYEIRSIVDEGFSEGAATRMFNIAKAIKVQPAS